MTYNFGNHVSVQLNVTLAVPVQVHINLDAFGFSLGD